MISNECNGCEYKCSLSHIAICTLGSPCPNQRSTPMTNEEWFCSLPTEEKAIWIERIMFIVRYRKEVEDGAYMQTITKKDYIENWLKEKHDG